MEFSSINFLGYARKQILRSIIVAFLSFRIAQVNAFDLSVNLTAHLQNKVMLIDEFSNKLADTLVDRAVCALPLRRADLDKTTNAKNQGSKSLAVAATRPLLLLQSYPHSSLIAPQFQSQSRTQLRITPYSFYHSRFWPISRDRQEVHKRLSVPRAATSAIVKSEAKLDQYNAATAAGAATSTPAAVSTAVAHRRDVLAGTAGVAAVAALKWPVSHDKILMQVRQLWRSWPEAAGVPEVIWRMLTEITLVPGLQGGLFADSKNFVDMPLRSDPQDVLVAFHALPRRADGTLLPREVEMFIARHFNAAGSDLEEIVPGDWEASPAFLAEITDEAHRSWAIEVNALWRGLVRRPVRDVFDHPQRHTLLWTPHPVVVPGGRFRESYYWDSLWIVKGLLVSGMHVTASGVVENLLSFCERFGFVPNGGRSYYAHRSQPPMLSEMVLALVDDFNQRGQTDAAQKLIQRSLPVLEKEYDFWLQNRTVKLNDGLFLSHYDSGSSLPRPESFREDVALLRNAPSVRDPASLFRAIAAGAESGWDFSSRWLADGQTLGSIDTTDVFPVDLNAILLRMELNLRSMHLALGNDKKAGIYGSFAKSRFAAMNSFMWSDASGCWRDITRGLSPKKGDESKTASSFIPLWALARTEDVDFLGASTTQVASAVAALDKSGLIRPGGVATTSIFTGQQWDWPNAWPPLQEMLIEGLVNGLARDQGGAELGKEIAAIWVETNFRAWQKHRFMFEKYDADVLGDSGGGGEYIPQMGFGWTNGVALVLLSQFYSHRNPVRARAS